MRAFARFLGCSLVVTVAVACGGSSSDEGGGAPADSGTDSGGGSGADGGGSGGAGATGGSGGSSATGGTGGSTGGTGGSTGGTGGSTGGSAGAAATGGSGGAGAAAGSGGGTQTCVPGDSKGCVGPGACTGYQVCAQDGSRYEPCNCGTGGSGGGAGAGGSAGSAGAAGTAGAAGAAGAAGSAGAGGAAGAAGAGAEVSCGEATPTDCSAGDVCCVVQGSPDTCTASGSCTCSGFGCTFLEVTCDGPEDCPGSQVCCGTFVQGPGPGGSRYTSVVCAATCDGGNERRLCHSDNDCSGQYSDCDPSAILPSPFQRCN
ncbi:MAG: hypothetical protein IT376_04445 [Polyangiaceae bacterium]|nr:hypothetical protein [Polyangiaceae bacterium]